MENNKQVGRIERFYEEVKDFFKYSGIYKLIMAGLVIGLTLIIIIVDIRVEYAGFKKLFTYPQEEFQYLSTEMEKVIVDNKIDMGQISDNEIEYTITYSKSAEESEWDSCRIEIKKEQMVYATITKSDDGVLNSKISYQSKAEYHGVMILTFGIFTFFVALILFAGLWLLFRVFKVIIFLAKCVEIIVLHHKKTT